MAGSPLQALDCGDVGNAPNGPAMLLTFATAAEKRLVMRFASAAARDAAITVPEAGMVAYLTTPKQLTMHDGTSWLILSEPTNTITAAVKQNNVALTTTTLRAEYSRDRDMVDAFISIQISSAGTTATELKVTPTGLPAPGSNRGPGVGTWWYIDAGANYYAGVVNWDGVDIHFISHGNGQYLGIAPNFAAANGDQIVCALRYRT